MYRSVPTIQPRTANVNRPRVLSISIPLPPAPMQKKIATFGQLGRENLFLSRFSALAKALRTLTMWS